jgi:hypothetical protein
MSFKSDAYCSPRLSDINLVTSDAFQFVYTTWVTMGLFSRELSYGIVCAESYFQFGLLNHSSIVQITKHACSLSCSECLPLVTAITVNNITVFGLDWVCVFQTATRYFF